LTASSHSDRRVFVTDETLAIYELPIAEHSVWAMTFHPKLPSILATGCLGGSVHVHDVRARRHVRACIPSRPQPCAVSSLAFHPHLPLLVAAVDHRLVYYDWRADKLVDEVHAAEDERVRYVRRSSSPPHRAGMCAGTRTERVS